MATNKTTTASKTTAVKTTAKQVTNIKQVMPKVITQAQKIAQACKLYGIPQQASVSIVRYNGKPINKQVATAAFMAVATANAVPVTTKLFGCAYNTFGLCYMANGTLAKQFVNGNTRMYCHYGNMQAWQALSLQSKYINQFTIALQASVLAIAKLQGITPQTVKTALIKATTTNASLNQLATNVKVA